MRLDSPIKFLKSALAIIEREENTIRHNYECGKISNLAATRALNRQGLKKEEFDNAIATLEAAAATPQPTEGATDHE